MSLPIDAESLLKTKSRNKNKINVCFDGLTFKITIFLRSKRKAVVDATFYWTNGRVPYKFKPGDFSK